MVEDSVIIQYAFNPTIVRFKLRATGSTTLTANKLSILL
ncbi:protein of unknown function [Candidatus Nitrosocaldus cavascurensis]|uniref:Uncharacterized protein n=1 Tax=Candidatus Nitrosocaldus cavascurensis TaxID=2058097 RepID=A0A2K5ARG6_9ARCH|nr:protein of unknown function [Candidatus Nitrosocaldus cavascurensis]